MSGVSDLRSILPDSAAVENDALTIGGCDVESLAAEYGTPLYVYDWATLTNQARRVRAAFGPDSRCSFAAKACETLGVLRVFADEQLGLDVVSLGEMEAGMRAGFTASRIHLHGNVKTDEELEAAVRHKVHAIVLDNLEEIVRLEEIGGMGGTTNVMLRLVLPLEARTHPHLQTSGSRSKFALLHGSAETDQALRLLRMSRSLRLSGLLTHLGSQITEPEIYAEAAQVLTQMAEDLRLDGFPIQEVSVGGGWAVPYRPDDDELTPEAVAEALLPVFAAHPGLRLAVEPGRALAARAGVAVYRVGSVKTSRDRRIVAVDGGMGDNPRPALYGARYTALSVRRPFAASRPADVVGRYCESGDVLAPDVLLPEVAAGDLVSIPVSGAYHLSMASSYNLVPQPAVVMVRDGRSRLLTRRACIEDLLAREVLDDLGDPAAAARFNSAGLTTG